MYPPGLQEAAARLQENPDAQLVFKYYTENLREAVLAATEEKEVLIAHNEHAAVRDFMEFISTVAATRKDRY